MSFHSFPVGEGKEMENCRTWDEKTSAHLCYQWHRNLSIPDAGILVYFAAQNTIFFYCMTQQVPVVYYLFLEMVS